jgi:hypothetical protein
LIFPISNLESNSLACWGVFEKDRLELKRSEYFCSLLNEDEFVLLDPILAGFESISFFNMSHSPEKYSRLNDLKWERKWNEVWGGRESENTSIKVDECCLNVNFLTVQRSTSDDIVQMLGSATTSFAFLSVDTFPDDIKNVLSTSVVTRVFSSINYPKMLNGITSKKWLLIRKNFGTPSLNILSPDKIFNS